MSTAKPIASKTSPAAKKSAPAKAAPVAAKAAQPRAKPEPAAPAAKLKLVRDSFTIPKHEYVVLDELKQRAASLKRPAKKSELLRAGIAALKAMPDKSFLSAINAVPSLKTGRPGGTKTADKTPETTSEKTAQKAAAKTSAVTPKKAPTKKA